MYKYRYPRPMVTTDIVLFRDHANSTELLLIERARDPYQRCWAFPGGFVEENEDLVVAAHRELQEETGLTDQILHQHGAVGTPGRDPRGHTVSVVYTGTCPFEYSQVHGADDAAQARWFPLHTLPELAFDHATILAEVRAKTFEGDAR